MECFPEVMSQLGPSQLAKLGAQAKQAQNAPSNPTIEEEAEEETAE